MFDPLYQLPKKYYDSKTHGGRIDIEDISIRVSPSALYRPVQTNKKYKANWNECFCDARKYENYDDDDDDEDEEDEEDKGKDNKNEKSITDVIKEYLLSFKQKGIFSCGGSVKDALPPLLFIDDIGYISLPITENNIQNVISKCTIAPFGRKEDTIIDTNVRNTWQMEPSQFSIKNPGWESSVQSIVYHVSCKLGCNPRSVKGSLYKLLVYGPGCFFKPHTDSEKEQGMFGSLIIILPSIYSGGQLIVRHHEKECEYDFSNLEKSREINYAAFYADCQHEIKPVTTGYRVCLVYNLINTDTNITPTIMENSTTIQNIAKAVNDWVDAVDVCPKYLIYGLDHRYTDAGLCFGGLKGKDIAILRMLMTVSDSVPLTICLINMMRERMNDEYSGEELINNTSITIWVSERGRICPYIDSFSIDDWNIVQNNFWKKKPKDFEQTEDTGNQGTQHSRQYHHTGIIFWPSEIKHHTCIGERLSQAVAYLRTLKEKSDMEEASWLIIDELSGYESLYDLDKFIDCFSQFDSKNQAAELTDFIMSSGEFDINKRILYMEKLYTICPSILTNLTFRNNILDLINKISDSNKSSEYKKLVITEFRRILDESFPKGIESPQDLMQVSDEQ